MPDPTILAILLTTLLTFILTIVELMYSSKGRVRACINAKYPFYLIIQLIGNIVTTLLASYLLSDKLPTNITQWFPIFFSFSGVFAFELVLSNTNINLFDNKILSFQDWILKAKDPVVARAIKKETEYLEKDETKMILELCEKVPSDYLRNILYNSLDTESKKQFEEDISAKNPSEKKIYVCQMFAISSPIKAKTLLAAKNTDWQRILNENN